MVGDRRSWTGRLQVAALSFKLTLQTSSTHRYTVLFANPTFVSNDRCKNGSLIDSFLCGLFCRPIRFFDQLYVTSNNRGQRHQLFIVAKVGERYRVLAALHHQWLYGVSVVAQSAKVIRILQASHNQPSIRRELQQAARRWSKDGKLEVDDKQPAAFPFLTTCLFIGASIHPGGDFAPAVQIQPLPLNTYYNAITNDDGISIYDVTSAPDIRYAFNLLDNSAGESIITAGEYIDSYRPENIWDGFSKLSTIDAAALESAWPGSKWINHHPDANANASLVSTTADAFTGLSLKETAKSKLVIEALQDEPDNLIWFEV